MTARAKRATAGKPSTTDIGEILCELHDLMAMAEGVRGVLEPGESAWRLADMLVKRIDNYSDELDAASVAASAHERAAS